MYPFIEMVVVDEAVAVTSPKRRNWGISAYIFNRTSAQSLCNICPFIEMATAVYGNGSICPFIAMVRQTLYHLCKR